MRKNKIFLYSIIFIITFSTYFCSSDMPTEEAAKLANDIANEAAKTALNESLETITAVGACVGLVVNLYDIGKDAKSCIAPSKEEQVRAQDIDKQLKLIELKKKLRLCLIKNKKRVQKGSFEIPSECEETALLLGTMGALNEVHRMINVMKEFDN
ncbi:hypothetical protein HYV10_00085 [Candidatus Dependentiae bacterium]|nr:hypothetical protein [Candidatus Dependentiae bacterium]